MELRRFILATAGHVDHGKSALVRALTGIDPDRLPEEKLRGITIELGFAQLELRMPDALLSIGIVDVPGHEDFVKNMVAGVGSIDLALLVVAADDGWMPQTEEHLQILVYLGVRRIVLCDTVGHATPNGVQNVIRFVSRLVTEIDPEVKIEAAVDDLARDGFRHIVHRQHRRQRQSAVAAGAPGKPNQPPTPPTSNGSIHLRVAAGAVAEVLEGFPRQALHAAAITFARFPAADHPGPDPLLPLLLAPATARAG